MQVRCKRCGLIPGLGSFPGGECGIPLQLPCLENPMDGGAWQTAVHKVAIYEESQSLEVRVNLWRDLAHAHRGIEIIQSQFF